MRGLGVGSIVHVFDVTLRDYPPSGIGPYAAIVTFVHEDGETIDCHTFGPAGAIIGNIKPRKEGTSPREWWAFPTHGDPGEPSRDELHG